MDTFSILLFYTASITSVYWLVRWWVYANPSSTSRQFFMLLYIFLSAFPWDNDSFSESIFLFEKERLSRLSDFYI